MITWFGRFICTFIGLALFGPIGLLIGFAIGYQLDRYFAALWQRGHWAAQNAFFNTTFKVMGYIAKADGRVSEQEIRAARQIMQRMGLDKNQRLRAIDLFNQGKEGRLNLTEELSRLRQVCHRQQPLLRMFLEIQFQAALADGYLSTAKQRILEQVCVQLGIAPLNFAGFGYQQHRRQQGQREQSYQDTARPIRSQLDEAYAVLNIAKTASNAEVKKAYRKLMSQNHPDKLVSKGLPESMIKLATEKTQQIQKAYDQICAARGM